MIPGGGLDRWLAAGLVALLMVIYNANGREIGSYDSQPTKYAARELLLRRTLALNHVVGAAPGLIERSGFVATADGRYRSAYSPTPSILAAVVTWPLWKAGVLDIQAPLAPNVISALGASLLTSLAVALAFLTARRQLSRRAAMLLALGLGLGTGFWPTVSQTLWQHESAVLGLALAVYGLSRAERDRAIWPFVVAGIGLGLAGTSRPQLAPAAGILLVAVYAVGGRRAAILTLAVVLGFAGALIAAHLRWFGHPLGAMPLLEALHPTVHSVQSSFRISLDGFAGSLIAPNRGLLIFSPVVLVAFAGIRSAFAGGWHSVPRWCALAAVAQYLLYSSYSVWWGGHTFGPRYMLDVLPLLVPLGAAGLARVGASPVSGKLAALALAWSVTVSATGAFIYPNDRWNTDPVDVDRHHERLWEWSDLQITRCWRRGPSPQNFTLFDSGAFHVRSR